MTEQLGQSKQTGTAATAADAAQEQVQVQLDAVTRAMDRAEEEARLAAEERQRQHQAEQQAEALRRSEEERLRAEDALRARELTERKELGMTLAETYRQRRREEKERRAALAAKRKEARLRAEAEAEKKRQELQQRLAEIERERADAQRRVEDSEALLREAEQVRRELEALGVSVEEPAVEKSESVPQTPPAPESAPSPCPDESPAATVLTYGGSKHRLRPEKDATEPTVSSAPPVPPLTYAPPPLYYVGGAGILYPPSHTPTPAPQPAPSAERQTRAAESSRYLTGTAARLHAVQAGVGTPTASAAAGRPAVLSVSEVPRPVAGYTPAAPADTAASAEEASVAPTEEVAAAPDPASEVVVAIAAAPVPDIETTPAATPVAPETADACPPTAPVNETDAVSAPVSTVSLTPDATEMAPEDTLSLREPDYLAATAQSDPAAVSAAAMASAGAEYGPSPQEAAQEADVPSPTPIPEIGLRTLPQEQTPAPAPADAATNALTAGLPVTPDPIDTERETERQRLTELDGYANEWEHTEDVRTLDKRTYYQARSRYLRAEHRLAKKGASLERAVRHSFGQKAQKKLYERLQLQQERIRMMSWRLLGADTVGDARERSLCERELPTLIGDYHRLLTDYEKLTGTREQRLPDSYVQQLLPYGRMPVLPSIDPPPAPAPRPRMDARDRQELEKLGAVKSDADALAMMSGTKGGVPLREQFEREKQVNEARLAYREGQLRYRAELSRLSVGGSGAGRREKRRISQQLTRIRRARRPLLAAVKADNARYERVAGTEVAYAKCARGADRERMEQLRVRLCALLAERDAANRRLLTLYRGAPDTATPAQGARMNRQVTDGKLQAAAKNKRKSKKLEKKVLRMQIREAEKDALFALMNRRGALTAEVAEQRYRLRHSAKDRTQVKDCRRELRRLQRALRETERDLSRQLRRAERQSESNRRDRATARRTLLSLIVLLVIVALGLLAWRLLLPTLTAYLHR